MQVFSNASSLVVVAAAMVAAAAVIATVAIRSSSNERPLSFGRRNLMQRHYFPTGLSCDLFMKDVEYGPTSDKPKGYSIDEWFCELSAEDSFRLGVEQPYFLEISNWSSIVPSGAIPGQSTMIATEATIDFAETTLYIPHEANVSIENRKKSRSRKLAAKKGILDVLVIRVTDKKGISPVSDSAQLRNDIYKDKVSLKTQFEACSYGKLRIKPFSGTTETNLSIRHGIVDLTIDYDISEHAGEKNNRIKLQSAAFRAAEETIGNLRGQFDAVMFCMPPGTGVWLAYAFVNDQFSFYNDKWCSYVSGQLHEVGHNLGLAHSGEGEDAYQDQQGIMGLSYGKDDQRICYNPAKSYQLGWYDDKVKTIDPLSRDPINGIGKYGVGEFTMNGVSDYENNDSALIVLRLVQSSSEKDYYIGYNRKIGINADTVEDGDMITIVRKEKGAPDEFGQSTKVASLEPGQSHTIESFDGQSRRDVRISFIGLRDGDATIVVVDVRKAQFISNGNHNVQCAPYRIELMTGSQPNTNSWFVSEAGGIGRVYAKSPVYTERETLYATKLCLPYNIKFNFVIKDDSKSSRGRRSYNGYDEDGNIIFSGGSASELLPDSNAEVKSFIAFDVKSFVADKDASGSPSFIRSKSPSISPPASTRVPSETSTRQPSQVSSSNMPSRVLSSNMPSRVSTSKRPSHGVSPNEPSKKPLKKVLPKTRKKQRHVRRSPVAIPTLNPTVLLVVPPYKEPAMNSSAKATAMSSPSTREPMETEPESAVVDCTDSTNHYRWDRYSEMLTCEQVGERSKCYALHILTQKALWHYCPESCNRCPTPMAATTIPTGGSHPADADSFPKEEEITMDPTAAPPIEHRRPCEDAKQTAITWSPGHRKITCQQISETEKCGVVWFKTSKPLWHVCQRSCNKCDETLFI